ncbi:hypothetical protein VSDG_06418 [Cytospora chrysosperma]|uniref:Uncharacterized protein n=1 Tax=Cytospora chrysosperma TaxID=252740 RepID=A0A423VPF5_CYTCH|nr:hypothetical protein VSDG_06418 [Valsa sordida]
MFESPGSYFDFEDGSVFMKHIGLAVIGGKQLEAGMDQLDLTKQELKTAKTLGAWIEKLGYRAQGHLPKGFQETQHASFESLALDVDFEHVPVDMQKYTRTELVMFAATKLDDGIENLDQTNEELSLLSSLGALFGKLSFRAQVLLALGHEKDAERQISYV